MHGIASSHPSIYFITVSHSDQEPTNRWIAAIGDADKVEVITDPSREFAQWGLDVSSFWHVESVEHVVSI